MTIQEIEAKLGEYPGICQTWESAVPFGERGDGGILYLSSIVRGEESIGTVHVCVWDRSAMGKPEMGRIAARYLMELESLDRLLGEIDCKNFLALNWAKRVGFKEIGVVRQRKCQDGQTRDVVLLDALPGDLVWE